MTVKTQFRHVGSRPVRPDGLDKVTGRARYGADMNLQGQLYGHIIRSPHAHARIKSIDFSEALKVPGVLATMSGADLPEPGEALIPGAEIEMKLKNVSPVIMARDKVLYHSHAVAAVAATSPRIAAEAAKLVKVEYEVLPAVLDMHAALAEDAPLLHDDNFTVGIDPPPEKPSNVSVQIEMAKGDLEAGFAAADVVIERTVNVPMCHQAYIEPHACVAKADEKGRIDIWCTTQGPFVVRLLVAEITGIPQKDIKVTASEIGGGFGGKTTVYIEPVAAVLAKKSGRPVKIVMSREEVFRASGPVSDSETRVKIGAKKDGTITAIDSDMIMNTGAYSASAMFAGVLFGTAPYTAENIRSKGREVLTNLPRVWAYRAPGAPQALTAVECVVSELAAAIGMDPIEFRLKNAVQEGDVPLYGMPFSAVGLKECLQAAKDHPNYQAALGENQGRGVACAFWINAGMQSSASIHVTPDGGISVMTGSPDIGGSRASMALMAAEVLGVPVETVHPAVVDTDSIGFCDGTGGSRTTLATGGAVIQAAEKLVEELRRRAAAAWSVSIDDVAWLDGKAVERCGVGIDELIEGTSPVKDGAKVLTLAEIALTAGATGGPLTAVASLHAHNSAPSFAVNVCDVEVDPETGKVDVLRFTCAQDAGKAIHPAYVEGQMQGGAVQGIGWALNEEYLFNADGVLDNAGFLDYRIPVASDLPMIDTVIVEVPNPLHPYGVRGVGEVSICPPMPAVVSAVNNAAGTLLYDLPMSPPKLLAAIDAG
ncbi:xanthine dehydrogenase family protein molybdopterin-binding subunit [Mangrovimicrobium sediminis]|uniref:Xanthine dehydrogenase family protein molybdopterin-binding subunit n=2 Tax=Mangrovimicrobium sediminis TaxID=2562682 RepID=A0A4Z0M861_9GAMM|nr:xanthine dehydrogenase family protein molybdopterin-binding subunit [Haliea sp. SAOS-164]